MKIFYFLLSIAMVITMAQAKVTIDYMVKRGESLSSIARKYHTTRYEIIQTNGLNQNEPIKLGMRLKITMNTYIPKKMTLDTKNISTEIKIVKNTHTLKEIRANKLKIAQINSLPKTHTLKEIKSKYISKQCQVKIVQTCIPKKTHPLKIAKSKKTSKSKYLVRASRQKMIEKKKKKVKIVQVKKVKKISENTKILIALRQHSKLLAKKRYKKIQQRVTVDDIFFKSSKRHIASGKRSDSTKANKIINIAKTKLGRKYVWGATGQGETFDCSGFTSYVYKQNGIRIPRTSRNQSKYGKYVARDHLKKGDLIFFDTSKHRKGYVNHVGIYLGNGKFIHASSAKKKVTISNLSKFYAQRYVGARRPS